MKYDALYSPETWKTGRYSTTCATILGSVRHHLLCKEYQSKISNDRLGLTRSAILLILFIVIHAVGNLHVFKGRVS